jgi:hypothetical protein
MPRLLAAALVAVLAVTILVDGGGALDAQAPSAEPGDFYWQLAHRGVMADVRMQRAFALLVDADGAMASAGIDGKLVYADPQVRQFIDEVSPDEATLLLAASGFADPEADLVQDRPCRYWATDLGGAPAVAAGLGDEVGRVLSELGIEGPPCEFTPTSTEADILVWPFGFSSEATANPPAPGAESFIITSILIPGGTLGGPDSGLRPPITGSGGLLVAAD